MTKQPRILIVGGGRAGSFERSYASAFEKLGWEVRLWDPAVHLAAAARLGRLGRLVNTFVHVEPWLRTSNLELLKIAESYQPDMLLVVATSGLRPGSLAQFRVHSPRTRLYMMFPDSPHSLDVDRIASLPLFDRVATTARPWAVQLERLGARKAHYVPFAADTFIFHPPAQAPAVPQWDLCFVGNWRAERQAVLEHLHAYKTVVWGSDYWKTRTAKASAVRRQWSGRILDAADIPAACANTAIVLNILDVISWPGPNMRSFETPACGAFTLSSRTAEILEIFEEGRSIECFVTPQEAEDKTRFYLANEAARKRIALAGHELVVRGGHTYVDRAMTIAGWAKEDA